MAEENHNSLILTFHIAFLACKDEEDKKNGRSEKAYLDFSLQRVGRFMNIIDFDVEGLRPQLC